MLRSQRNWGNDKGGVHWGMRRALREEKVLSVYVTDRLLLAHYEEGYNRICEEMPQLPSVGQLDSYPPTKLIEHGHPMTLPYLGA